MSWKFFLRKNVSNYAAKISKIISNCAKISKLLPAQFLNIEDSSIRAAKYFWQRNFFKIFFSAYILAFDKHLVAQSGSVRHFLCKSDSKHGCLPSCQPYSHSDIYNPFKLIEHCINDICHSPPRPSMVF